MRGEESRDIPQTIFENLFEEDPVGEKFFEHWLGNAFPDARRHLKLMGARGAAATPFSARADKHPPVLQSHDAVGQRVNRVEYHPDYRELEKLSYGAGIVAIKYDKRFLEKHRADRHMIGFGGAFYFAQTELGLFCPICMTDGVARVLEMHGRTKVHQEALERLTSADVATLWQGAMFLTEKQGGSDVGANRVSAHEEHGRWYLNGDKWFCSNVDAEAILVLARMPRAPEGTKGLGLFLVLRQNPPRNETTIVIHRLKDKLGVRSMPTGEVTFAGTEGNLLGGIGEGFKMMAEMMNLSRLYNAVASTAAMRRAVLEALAYGARRQAFGKPLWSLPLWRSTMSDMVAESIGAFALVFEAVRTLDRADAGEESAKKLVRVLIPMVKILSGKIAINVISESMEAIGGNAYVEESILPRLLRDAQVLPIWEGTSNLLTLDVLRVNRKESGWRQLAARTAQAVATARKEADLVTFCDLVSIRMEQDANYLKWLASQSAEDEERGGRQWVENAGRTLTLALMLEAATFPPLHAVAVAVVRRLLARPYGAMAAMSLEAVRLKDTETELLRAGYEPKLADG